MALGKARGRSQSEHHLKRDMSHFLHAMKYKSTGAGSGVQQRLAEAQVLMKFP